MPLDLIQNWKEKTFNKKNYGSFKLFYVYISITLLATQI